jgi:hypothetical protein
MSRRSKIAIGVLVWPLGVYWALMAHRSGRSTSIALAIIWASYGSRSSSG